MDSGVFRTSYYIITRTFNNSKFILLALMKSVVVDSYEYEWKFT